MKAPVCLCLCRGRGFTLLTICHACVLCFPLCSISLTTCVNTLYRVLRSPSAEELFIQLWPVLTSGPVSQTQLRPHQLPLFSITTSTPSSTCSCPLTASVFKLKNPPNIYLKPSHVEVETMNEWTGFVFWSLSSARCDPADTSGLNTKSIVLSEIWWDQVTWDSCNEMTAFGNFL